MSGPLSVGIAASITAITATRTTVSSEVSPPPIGSNSDTTATPPTAHRHQVSYVASHHSVAGTRKKRWWPQVSGLTR